MLATLTVVCIIGILFMLFLLIGGTFYSRKGWNKKFFHDVMSWHEPTKNITYNGLMMSLVIRWVFEWSCSIRRPLIIACSSLTQIDKK